jgi:hypothetical protein
MALFSKESCVLCEKEAGALGRTKLTDKGSKLYICNDCVKTKLSPYVLPGYMSKADVDGHLVQREKDAEIYEQYFKDFSYPKVKELFTETPWGSWNLGKYELRHHRESGYYCIWEPYPKEGQTFDVFHKDEAQGACIWGEYKVGSDVKILPDTTHMTLTELKEYPDKDIQRLTLTIFTTHPYLSLIDIPMITNGGKADANERIRENALNIADAFNKGLQEELDEHKTTNKEFRQSAKETRKSLFGALKEGAFNEDAQAKVGTFLTQMQARKDTTTVDDRIADLRRTNDPKNRF